MPFPSLASLLACDTASSMPLPDLTISKAKAPLFPLFTVSPQRPDMEDKAPRVTGSPVIGIAHTKCRHAQETDDDCTQGHAHRGTWCYANPCHFICTLSTSKMLVAPAHSHLDIMQGPKCYMLRSPIPFSLVLVGHADCSKLLSCPQGSRAMIMKHKPS